MNKNKILWGNDKNAVIALLAINLVVYVFFRMLFIIFQNDPETHLKDYNGLLQQFVVNSNANVFIQKPWTLVTYFFTNPTFFGLLSNMLWLFCFAYLLQQLVDNRYLFPSFIYGGIVGGIVFVLTILIANPTNTIPLVGSTTAILSVAGTLVGFVPKYKLFPLIKGGIPLWVLVALFLLVDVISIGINNLYFIPAHLAALGFGYFYAKSIARGNDFGNWMHTLYNAFLGKTEPIQKKETPYYRQTITPYSSTKKINQTNINLVLDKINMTGYSSLTDEEKLILQQAKDQPNFE